MFQTLNKGFNIATAFPLLLKSTMSRTALFRSFSEICVLALEIDIVTSILSLMFRTNLFNREDRCGEESSNGKGITCLSSY